jgi:pimeloyl-ACP methyl ester carboxylesterase
VRRLRNTQPFRGSSGELLPGSIADVAYLRLGGFDQYVMIRGESLSNPPLILLHGGPGFSDTPLFRRFNAALEKRFTMVYWDQRGTRKSFDPSIPRSSMTVEQFLTDLDELVERVRARVGKKRVVIFGHSWGSALGVLYAARFPEKVACYVGCAQIGDSPAAEATSYALAVAEATRQDNHKVLRALDRIGPPPYGASSSVFTERTCWQQLDGQLRPSALWTLGRIVLGAPDASMFDLPKIVRGFRFSIDAMWTETSQLNLLKLVPALQMPAFFLLGRRDHWVPPDTSVAYVDVLTAPSKTLVWFEESGHEPFVDEPVTFNRAMVDLVRPAAGDSPYPAAAA